MGQVLLPFDRERVWQALLPHCAVPEPDLRQIVPRLMDESGTGCGTISGEEFHQLLIDRCGLRLPFDRFRSAWSDMFWIDEEVVGLIARAPVRQRVLLSNTDEIHWN